MKRFSLVIVILLAAQFIFAQNTSTVVSNKEAMTYGLNFMQSQYPTRAAMNISSYELIKSETTGKDCYHVFNFENGGFVIVCADRRSKPIFGFSNEGSFNSSEIAPALKEWIKQYTNQLDIIESKNLPVPQEAIVQWNPNIKRSTPVEVGPFITTFWNQDYPYNMLCPEHQAGDHGHTYTGCVATAMAQVMKYWNYPQKGTGIISYFWGENIVVDLSETTYDWENMPNYFSGSSSEEQKLAVATLMYHCGITINMDYGYTGSGTQTEYTVDALRNNFGYRSGINYKARDNGSTSDFEHYYENDTMWSRMLMEELDMHRPMIYSGHPSSGSGHAWVCDGYKVDGNGNRTFHMNWGWGVHGGNGYFAVDNLNTHASAGDDDDSNNFVYGQGAVFNIAVQDLDVTPYCMQDSKTVYEEEHWTINDGSYANYYKKNTNCDWLINVKDNATDTVMFYFKYFELGSGDELKIYAGEDETGELLYTFYDGNEPTDTIKYFGTPLYLHFTTDGEDQARGWELYYEALRYPYSVTTSVSGVGGTISPEGVRPVMEGTTLAVVMNPTPGNAVKEFTIDGSITLKGTGTGEPVGYTFINIKANHTIDVTFEPVSVEEENISNISIFPNPNNGKFSVNLGENAQSYVLYDMSGRIVEEKAVNGLSVVDFDMNIAAGTYFIKVITDDKVSIEKVIIE